MDIRNFLIFDTLSGVTAVLICLFTLVLLVYSLGYIGKRKSSYFVWFLLTFLAAHGAVISKNLILLLIFWGFLGLTFLKLMNLYDNDEVNAVSKKTMIIIGGSDSFLILGFLIYAVQVSSFSFGTPVDLAGNSAGMAAFIFICIGSFAKAGAMPFHTWIPDTCKSAPLPVVAFLPACLDKLLGIYLLVRAVRDMFILNAAAQALLLIVGGLTVICAVMMALVQHNIKKLLGFHAVSQVGYMVIGIGCGTPLGLAGALFHMVNNAIYKSCLFLGIGNVEKRTGESDLDNLSGMAKFMPLTFISMLIAALSISGIPPLNGFVSKWMVYQGMVDFINTSEGFPMKSLGSGVLILGLIGSGLTLASFIKVISGVFLGRAKKKVKEVGALLYGPPLFLSLLCIILGVFFYKLVLPLLTSVTGGFDFMGVWEPQVSTMLIFIGIILGIVLFKVLNANLRMSDTFTGGNELLIEEDAKVGDFYSNFKEIPVLKRIYLLAGRKIFDIYEQSLRLVFALVRVLRYLHNGVLPTYIVWCLLGMLGLFLVFFK